MHHYRLIFASNADSATGEISFQAECADRAFGLVRRHAQAADLWVDGQLLCTMWHGGEDDYWVITSAAGGAGAERAECSRRELQS